MQGVKLSVSFTADNLSVVRGGVVFRHLVHANRTEKTQTFMVIANQFSHRKRFPGALYFIDLR